MMGNVQHFKEYSIVDGNIRIDIDLSRFDEQFAEAQFWLDSQIMNDMVPVMPQRDGLFIVQTRAESMSLAGTGKVVAGVGPMGRFLYMGKVMVDEETGSPWAQKGHKKIVTDRPLTYSNPQAVPEWFEATKAKHLNDWISGVKKRAGGGKP